MPRCAPVIALTSAVAMISAPLPGAAQALRSFPAHALRGEVVVTQPPELLLNKKPARLAPGARIFSTQNTTLVSGALAGERSLVHYTLDGAGQVQTIWLLTPEEAARKPWPTTPEQAASWRFDAAAQAWSRP